MKHKARMHLADDKCAAIFFWQTNVYNFSDTLIIGSSIF